MLTWLFAYVSRPLDDKPPTWRTYAVLIAAFLATGLIEGLP